MRGVFTQKISRLVWKCVLSSVHEKINEQAARQEGCCVMNHYYHLQTTPLVCLLIVFLPLTQMLDTFDRISLVCVPHSGKRESLRLCQIARNAHQSEHGGPSRADAHTPL